MLEVLEQHYVEARLHTDGDHGDELTELEQKLANSVATPLYVVVDPKTERVVAGPVAGTQSIDGFRAFLQNAQDARTAAKPEEKVGRLSER